MPQGSAVPGRSLTTRMSSPDVGSSVRWNCAMRRQEMSAAASGFCPLSNDQNSTPSDQSAEIVRTTQNFVTIFEDAMRQSEQIRVPTLASFSIQTSWIVRLGCRVLSLLQCNYRTSRLRASCVPLSCKPLRVSESITVLTIVRAPAFPSRQLAKMGTAVRPSDRRSERIDEPTIFTSQAMDLLRRRLLAALSVPWLTGCTVEIAGQTLPSPYYLTDDVQYYAPGPGFVLAREAAAAQEAKAAAISEPQGGF